MADAAALAGGLRERRAQLHARLHHRSACKAMWFNAYDPRTGWQLDEINRIRAPAVTSRSPLAGRAHRAGTGVHGRHALTAEYQAVVSAYGLRYIDFDIEGSASAEPASIARRNQAMLGLQAATPAAHLADPAGAARGPHADGLNVFRTARDAGVNIDLVNIMAMDYYRPGTTATRVQGPTPPSPNSIALPTRTDAQVCACSASPRCSAVTTTAHLRQNYARQLVSTATGGTWACSRSGR